MSDNGESALEHHTKSFKDSIVGCRFHIHSHTVTGTIFFRSHCLELSDALN